MKKLFTAALMICLTSLTVYADIDSYSVDYDYENDKIVIEAKLSSDKNTKDITVGILEDGYSFSSQIPQNEIQSAVEYVEQIRLTGTEEKVTFNIPITGQSRNLKAGLFGKTVTEPKYFDVKFVKNTEFSDVLTILKQKLTGYDVFKAFMNNTEEGYAFKNEFYLNCENIVGNVQKDMVQKIMYESLKMTINNIETVDDIEKLWKQSNLIALINDGNITDITDYEDMLDLSDVNISKWYKKVVSKNEGAIKLTAVLKNTDYMDTSDFIKALKKSLIVAVTKYPDGADNIGDVLCDFSDVSGITDKNNTSIYLQLAGLDFANFDDLLIKYNEFFNNKNSQSSSGGQGSSGGSIPSISVENIINNTPAAELVNMKYEDLDTVTWAYEAISTLSDMGILNGRTENRFMPDESITREEFVKILVCTLKLENESYTVHFNDASSDKWYSKYVNIAYEKGICTGISANTFGAGQQISRQDMAALLYRALLYKKYDANAIANKFEDDNEISPYAKDAVYALVNCKAVSGVGNNRFSPKTNATRAQAAKMVFGIIDVLR